jgi:hypothetical protein
MGGQAGHIANYSMKVLNATLSESLLTMTWHILGCGCRRHLQIWVAANILKSSHRQQKRLVLQLENWMWG